MSKKQHALGFVLSWVLIVAGPLILAPNPSLAVCAEYIKDTDNSFSVTEICSSSLKQPNYQIVRHYFDGGESLIFSFAPRSRKLLCHSYALADQTYENCDSYGVNFFPKELTSGEVKVRIVALDDFEEDGPLAMALRQQRNLFQIPDLPELVSIEGCFLAFTEKKELFIGYFEERLLELTNCLVTFEKFLMSDVATLTSTRFR